MKAKVFLGIRIAGTVLAFFNLLMFFALRPCWSGISSTLGYKGGSNTFLLVLPIIVCVLLFVILLCDLILKKIFKKDWLQILFLAIHVVFFAAIMVVIGLGAVDYMRFVWPKFFTGLAAVIALVLLYFLLFVYPKTRLKDLKVFKYGVLGVAAVLAVGVLANFTFNWITCSPVVYAVGDKYQIVFSTSVDATGYVEIGGTKYYDTYNGTTRTFDRIHKIEVPMEKLDASKKYTVHTQKSIYCGPFGGFLGRDISQSVDFKPVDVTDGIQYLSFSDIHMNLAQAAKTATFVENYDFLVLAGDIISDVETFEDANFNNEVAHAITKGQIPVVYARGNHDIKGRFGQELHKFVGAEGDRFYYTFYFKDIYGIVLDLGEDHDDDWWEYYGTAHYADYHEAQIEFLKEEIAKKDYEHYPYRVAISHIPIPFVNYRLNHEYVKKTMTTLLNQMDIDMYLCGHQHQLMIFEPGLIEPFTELSYNPNYKNKKYGGYLTDFNFPSFMVSKQGFTFKDATNITGAKSHIGFYVDVDLSVNEERCHYLNSAGEKVDVMNMFYDKAYGQEIRIDLTTKEFLPQNA
ncbi:MAG: metallophosphoesterase [Erysipelotrichaceae bacterium]|nr:metallophosphoesterase [Erysipelotrichaceae bacterium]